MIYEAAMLASLAKSAENHLLQSIRKGDKQEDLCFALWRPSTGQRRMTGVITELILPLNGDRIKHGNVSFEAQYLARVTRLACESKSGVAFMHSHPYPGWQDMSKLDVVAERDRIAPAARAARFPLLGLTVGSDGIWSARFWHWNGRKYERQSCSKVKTVGDTIRCFHHPSHKKVSTLTNRLRRTIDTWGPECQETLSSLRIGIVGLGSVGTLISETLARIGATDLMLIDADLIEEHNLDRMLYATTKDVGSYKVDFVADQLRRSATATKFSIDTKRSWLQERDAYQASLDCDLLFAAVDRPIPKDLLNNIAYVHCIPVIFGGIRVAKKPTGEFGDATWSVTRVGPGSRCLRCDNQYTSSDVTLERDGSLEDPTYIAGLAEQPGNENVLPFSLNVGSLMVLEMLRGIIREEWWPSEKNKLHYSYLANNLTTEKTTCRPGCSVADRFGAGDNWIYPFLEDPVHRKQHRKNVLGTLIGSLKRQAKSNSGNRS